MPIEKKVNKNFPLRIDSWEIISNFEFCKEMDRSAFLHHGTGIPKEIRGYFNIIDMQPGEKRYVKLVFKSIAYKAFFVMDRQPTPRTKLYWTADFDKVLRKELAWWFNSFFKGLKVEGRPLLHLETNNCERLEYLIQFLAPFDANHDNNEEQYQSQITISESSSEYVPPLRKEELRSKEYCIPPRSSKEGCLALNKAGFKCEVDILHMTFKTDQGQWYMEKHHLIPMEYYYDYRLSIDHYSNIFSLCPTCHRKIHYGSMIEKIKMIKTLFSQRKENFMNAYNVELPKILSYYDIYEAQN